MVGDTAATIGGAATTSGTATTGGVAAARVAGEKNSTLYTIKVVVS